MHVAGLSSSALSALSQTSRKAMQANHAPSISDVGYGTSPVQSAARGRTTPILSARTMGALLTAQMSASNSSALDGAALARSNDPRNMYAEVRIKGVLVGRVFNGGECEIYGGLSVPNLAQDGEGPELAQRRAEQIAAAAGGTIDGSKSAQSQAEWEASARTMMLLDLTGLEAHFDKKTEPAEAQSITDQDVAHLQGFSGERLNDVLEAARQVEKL